MPPKPLGTADLRKGGNAPVLWDHDRPRSENRSRAVCQTISVKQSRKPEYPSKPGVSQLWHPNYRPTDHTERSITQPSPSPGIGAPPPGVLRIAPGAGRPV